MCYVAFSIPGGLRAPLAPVGTVSGLDPRGTRAGTPCALRHRPGWLGLARPQSWAWLGSAGLLRFIYLLRLVGLGWLALAWLGFGWIWLADFAWIWVGFLHFRLPFLGFWPMYSFNSSHSSPGGPGKAYEGLGKASHMHA